MSTLTVQNDRTLSSTWNVWAIVSNGQGYSTPNDHAIFEWNFPANRFVFADEIYDNRLPIPSGLDASVIPPSIGGGFFNLSHPITQVFKMSRKYSYGGGDGGPWPLNQSIKCGFQVGNTFKMQCYVNCVGVITGTSTTYQGMIWSDAGCNSSIDYYLNCRLKQLYVKYGKIISIRAAEPLSAQQETSKERDVWIKIIEDTSGLPYGTQTVGVDMTVWSKKINSPLEEALLIKEGKPIPWVNVELPIKKINQFGEALVTVSDIQNSYLKVGDLFELKTPLIVNDPLLMYEYKLGLRNGRLGTTAQLFQLPGSDYSGLKIIGVWVGGTEKTETVTKYNGDEMVEKFSVYTPYANKEERETIYIPKTTYEMYRRKEDMEFGGTFNEGIALLKANNAQSVRLQLNWSGSGVSQNFSANCLAGQFAKIGDSLFEIIDNPRSDVIELSLKALDGDVNLFSVLDSSVEHQVFQNKFWLFNEFYTPSSNFLAGMYAGTVESAAASTANVNGANVKALTISWKSVDTFNTEFLTEKEKEDTGCETLFERIAKAKSKITDGSTEIFKKFKGWKLYNSLKKVDYEIVDLFIDEGGDYDSNGYVTHTVTAQVLADSADDFKNAQVYVVFGEPFDSLGLDRANQASVYTVALVEQTDSNLLMYNLVLNGILDLGYYQFDTVLESNTRICIVNTNFGLRSGSQYIPGLQTSTYKRAIMFCSAYKTDLIDFKHVLYKHSEYNILVDRYYKHYEKYERAIRFGAPLDFDKIKDSVDDYNLLIVTGAQASMAKPKELIRNNVTATSYYLSYWIRLPRKAKGNPNTFYFSSPISGEGGIETLLTRSYGLRLLPTSKGTTGAAAKEGILPYEISSPSPTDTATTGAIKPSVYVPVYYVPTDNKELVGDMSPDKFGLVQTGGKIDQLNTLINDGVIVGDPPENAISYSIEVTPQDSLAMDHSYAKVLTLGNGGMLLATSARWPAGSLVNNDVASPLVMDKYAACLMFSRNNGGFWRSPRYDLGGENEQKTSAYLLAVISDFYLIDAVLDEIDNEIYLFGYLSEKSSPEEIAKTKNPDGTVNTYNDVLTRDVCLSLYKFPYSHCYQKKFEDLKKITYKDITLSYYLVPTAKMFLFEPDPDLKNMPMDSCVRIMSKQAYDASLGTSQSSIAALIEYPKLTQNDVFSVCRNENGSINLYLQDTFHDGIICLTSADSGYTWSVNTIDSYDSAHPKPKLLEELNPVIYAARGTHPYVLENYLFYFKDKQDLYMKRIILEGSGTEVQELLDGSGELLIAEGIPPQRVSGLISNDSISIYYIDAKGNLKAIESKDNGGTWLPPVNW